MIAFRHSFKAMACVAEIQLYASDMGTAARVCKAAQREVERIEAKYSRYRDDSVTTAINRGAGVAPVAIDTETSALLDYADACWEQSEGLFDITSGVLRRVWDWQRGEPPDPSLIESGVANIGWQRVRRESLTIRLDRAMEIDFGGIGKEYAADKAAAVLSQAGISHGLVNLGGDIRALGAHPGGKPWKIGITHPRDTTRTIAHLSLADVGLATSGDYERFFVHRGKRYCHVLNPKTGWPADGPQSVSVVAPLCIVAGSCATIAMLREEGAGDYLREQGYPYLLIDREGNATGTLAQ